MGSQRPAVPCCNRSSPGSSRRDAYRIRSLVDILSPRMATQTVIGLVVTAVVWIGALRILARARNTHQVPAELVAKSLDGRFEQTRTDPDGTVWVPQEKLEFVEKSWRTASHLSRVRHGIGTGWLHLVMILFLFESGTTEFNTVAGYLYAFGYAMWCCLDHRPRPLPGAPGAGKSSPATGPAVRMQGTAGAP